jgi:hypothetical protein
MSYYLVYIVNGLGVQLECRSSNKGASLRGPDRGEVA